MYGIKVEGAFTSIGILFSLLATQVAEIFVSLDRLTISLLCCLKFVICKEIANRSIMISVAEDYTNT